MTLGGAGEKTVLTKRRHARSVTETTLITPESDTGGVADDASLGVRIRGRQGCGELVRLYSGRVFAMAMGRVRTVSLPQTG